MPGLPRLRVRLAQVVLAISRARTGVKLQCAVASLSGGLFGRITPPAGEVLSRVSDPDKAAGESFRFFHAPRDSEDDPRKGRQGDHGGGDRFHLKSLATTR